MPESQTAIFVEKLDLGSPGGPRVAVKDCIDIAGLPTRAGSGTLIDRPAAERNAPVVDAILAKGGHIVGKTNMHELAYGVTGINHTFGTPLNPRYPTLIPGGSSSGSAAAVAAGLVDVAIGSDTGGSIRLPATCCGLFGFKPTFGRISREGCEPAQSSLDCVGPLADDIAGIEQAMALIDPGFIALPAPTSLRLGRIETNAEPTVESALTAALSKCDLQPDMVKLPLLEDAFHAGITIMAAECWSAFADLTRDPRMGNDVRERLLAASKTTQQQVDQAEAVREAFIAALDAAFESFDALLLPTLPSLPPALDELGEAAKILRLTSLIRPFNLSGHPALTIPLIGYDERPAGLQIVGRPGADEFVCAVGRLICERLAL